MDAILYTVDNGAKWRALPADFPPWNTVYQRFAAWELAGASQRLLDTVRDRTRLKAGRAAAPSAGMIGSQSLRATPTVGRDSRGWDAAKKVQCRKHHIVVDTMGLLIAVLVTPASTHDKRAARSLLRRVRDRAGTRFSLVWADTGYHGALPDWAHTTNPGTQTATQKYSPQRVDRVQPV
ncbi:Transposase [Actinosynnema pretiosum]|nr:Transposase [Actinosynnema pretiosum]